MHLIFLAIFCPKNVDDMLEDRREQELTQQSDCEWVRALDASGNSIKISKADLLSTIKTILRLGEGSMEGTVLLTDNYQNGNVFILGQTFSYGSAYIGYCMKQENGKLLSTTSLSIPRSIFIFGPDRVRIGTAPNQSTPINEEITGLSWRDL